MRIVNKFTDKEIELLEDIGIEIREREYLIEEIKNLEDLVRIVYKAAEEIWS